MNRKEQLKRELKAIEEAERIENQAAAKDLGVDTPFSWHGYSTDQWRLDIQARIDKIQIEKKKKELEALEKRLDAILSPELKAEMELEAITKELEG